MPTQLHESNIDFEFPEGWTVSRYDQWAFYRNHFQNPGDRKAVDLLVIEDDDGVCWLVEVKDSTPAP